VAVGIDPAGLARVLLGIILMAQQKFTKEALQCFERERERDEYPLAHLPAARVLIAQGDPRKARSELQIYLSSAQPVNRDIANGWLGVRDQDEQNLAEVFSSLSRALGRVNDLPMALGGSGLYLLKPFAASAEPRRVWTSIPLLGPC